MPAARFWKERRAFFFFLPFPGTHATGFGTDSSLSLLEVEVWRRKEEAVLEAGEREEERREEIVRFRRFFLRFSTRFPRCAREKKVFFNS